MSRAIDRPTLPALNGLRFVAAAWVVAYHLLRPWLASTTSIARNLIAGAPFALSLFLVLSGFVLTYVYAPKLDRARTFYGARCARIFPIYALALVIAWPVGAAARHAGLVHDGYASLVFFATATQAWVPSAALQWDAPLWTVSVDVAFYVAFPVLLPIVARTSTRTLFAVGALLWAASVGLGVAYGALDPDHVGHVGVDTTGTWLHVLRFNPVVRFPDVFLGMAAAKYFVDRRRLPSFFSIAAIVVVAVVVASGAAPIPLLHGALLAPLACVIVLALATSTGPVARALSSTIAQRLGDTSYALYALHVPLWMWLAWFTHTKMNDTNKILVAVVAVAAAFAAHIAVERPLRRVLRDALSERPSRAS